MPKIGTIGLSSIKVVGNHFFSFQNFLLVNVGEDYLSNIKMDNVFSSPIMKQLFSYSASGKPKSLNTTVSIRSGVPELLVCSGNTYYFNYN